MRRLAARLTSRVGDVAESVRVGWWLVPAACLIAAIAFSLCVEWIDRAIGDGASAWYLFKGGPEAARSVLSTVAASMMTFTGVVFSVTVLVLQLASTQFSPRVLRTFLKDRPSQLALGTFVGTFVYSLLGLRHVRGAGDRFDLVVPSFTVWLSVVLAVVCVATFIAFIHHISQSIRAVVVIRRIADETRASLDRLYPEPIGEGLDEPPPDLEQPVTLVVPHLGRSGVLANVDGETLGEAAGDARVVLRLVPCLGDFVAHGSPLFEVCGSPKDLDIATAGTAMAIRMERDVEEDASFGVRQLVDVAERALSPGTNDPSTAVQVLDELHDILRRLARRRFPSRVRSDAGGRLLVVIPHLDFDGFVRLALDEIRHHGERSFQVLRRVRYLIDDLLRVAPPHRTDELRAQLALLDAAALRTLPDARDRQTALLPSAQG